VHCTRVQRSVFGLFITQPVYHFVKSAPISFGYPGDTIRQCIVNPWNLSYNLLFSISTFRVAVFIARFQTSFFKIVLVIRCRSLHIWPPCSFCALLLEDGMCALSGHSVWLHLQQCSIARLFSCIQEWMQHSDTRILLSGMAAQKNINSGLWGAPELGTGDSLRFAFWNAPEFRQQFPLE
jgi:hypothetical protein